MVEARDARAVFYSLVHIEVGTGDTVLFWRDQWIQGFVVVDIVPLVLATVQTRTANTRMV